MDLVRSLGADEVIDYKTQEFEDVLQGYDAVLGTVRGDALEKALRILKPGSTVVSLIGPPDAAFARGRGYEFLHGGADELDEPQDPIAVPASAVSRIRSYSCTPTVSNSRRSVNCFKSGRIRPVIDRVFAFDQAKDALAYLDQGRAKGKVVIQMR